MPTKESSVTTVADAARSMLTRNMIPNGGWSATTFAAEMQKAGHTWTPAVVHATINKGRLLTVDEVVGILGVFKAKATLMLREVDEVARLIVAETERARR
jgi:hypothetical protein